MPTLKEFKTLLIAGAVLTVFFSSFLLYRALEVDPVLDDVYSEIYGLDEEGEEW